MATNEEILRLQQAFLAADDAGNTEDAQMFANELRRLTAEPEKEYTWGDVIPEAIAHIPESGAEMALGLGHAITHPIETGEALVKGVVGIAPPVRIYEALTPEENRIQFLQESIDTANAIGGMYKDRYGSVDALKRTLAEDPVGAAMDLSALFGGAGAAAKTVGMAKTSATLGKVGHAIDPMRAVTAPVGALSNKLGAAGRHFHNVLDPKTGAIIRGVGDDGANIAQDLVKKQPYPGITAGEVASRRGNVGVAGLEAEVERVTPGTIQAYESARQSRDAARLTGLEEKVAKSDVDLGIMRAAREAEAEARYGLIREGMTGPATLQPTVDLIDKIIRENPKNRELVAVLQRAKNNLHDISTGSLETSSGVALSAYDDLRGVMSKAENAFLKKELQAVKESLISGISGGKEATAGYLAASAPINQMEVGRFVLDKLTGGRRMKTGAPISGQLQTGPTLTAMADEGSLIETATGGRYYRNLESLFAKDAEGLAELKKLQADMQSEVNYLKAKTQGGNKGGKKVPVEESHTIPLLHRVATVANFIFTRMKGQLNKKAAMELAVSMLNPKDFSAELTAALKKQARRDVRSAGHKKVGRMTAGFVESPIGKASVRLQDLDEKYSDSLSAKYDE